MGTLLAVLEAIGNADEKAAFDLMYFSSDDAKRNAQAEVATPFAQSRYASARDAAFGPATPPSELTRDAGQLQKEMQRTRDAVLKNTPVVIGDTAEISADQGLIFYMRKQDGQWKLDLLKTQKRGEQGPNADAAISARQLAAIKVFADMTADVKNKKFKSAEEADTELKQRLAQLQNLPVGDPVRNTPTADFANVATAIAAFNIDNRRIPTAAEGLAVLVKNPGGDLRSTWRGPYLDKVPLDRWDHAYRYTPQDSGSYELTSAGPDGKFGTADDITRNTKN